MRIAMDTGSAWPERYTVSRLNKALCMTSFFKIWLFLFLFVFVLERVIFQEAGSAVQAQL